MLNISIISLDFKSMQDFPLDMGQSECESLSKTESNTTVVFQGLKQNKTNKQTNKQTKTIQKQINK